MIFILPKEIYISGRISLYFGGFGDKAELILGIWGAKAKYFQGTEEIVFRDFGISVHYFREQGSKDPPGAS